MGSSNLSNMAIKDRDYGMCNSQTQSRNHSYVHVLSEVANPRKKMKRKVVFFNEVFNFQKSFLSPWSSYKCIRQRMEQSNLKRK